MKSMPILGDVLGDAESLGFMFYKSGKRWKVLVLVTCADEFCGFHKITS
jgi:hypothetical protein